MAITLKMAARLLPFLQAITLRRQTLKRFTCAAHIPGRVGASSCLMAIWLVLPSAAFPITQVGGGLWRGRLKFLIPKTGRKFGRTGFLVTQGGLTSVKEEGWSHCDVLLRKREG